MREIFLEETAEVIDKKSATIKYNIFKGLSYFFYALSGIYIFISLILMRQSTFAENVLINLLIIIVPFAILFAVGVIFAFFKGNFYLEYDYTFVSGSFRVNRVVKGQTNKLIFYFDTEKIEKLGKYQSQEYFRIEAMHDVKRVFLTQNKTPAIGKNFYYIFVNKFNGRKYLLIIECGEKFIAEILPYVNFTARDKEIR